MKIKNIIILICVFAMCLPLFGCVPSDPHQKSVAAKTENFSITRGELAYFFVRTMQSTLSSYSDAELKEIGYDKSKTPSEQKANGDQTWFDVFLAGALEYVKELLALCEAAKEANFSVNSEALAKKIADFKAKCEKTYSVSFEKYLDITYFGYTDEQDYVHALELEYLANAYMTKLTEDLCSNVSDDRIEEYIESNVLTPNNERTRSTMIIVLTEGGKARAESILSLFPEQSFEALAREHSAEETFLYKNCRRGELYGKEDEWLFDTSRVPGDTGIVENQDGTVSILYYIGEGLTVSEADAVFRLAKSDYSAYLDTLFERFSVNFEKEVIISLVI